MRIAIVDNINTDIDIISKHLHNYFSGNSMNIPLSIRTFPSGEALLQTFQRDTFDFIFMDCFLKGMSGLDTAYAVRKLDHTVIIIFTTASREYAIEGYKTRASGYLIKPISFEAFSETLSFIDLAKVRARHFIQIKTGYKLIKIPINDIIYCDISGHYVQIHTRNLGIQRSRMTFASLKELLMCYSEFLPCYRGCIINMNFIEHMSDCIFFLSNGERIPLSRKQNNEISEKYSEFLFDKVRNQNLQI